MTLRATSRACQWALWGWGTVAALAAYVVASWLVCGSVSFDLLDPVRYRLAMPLAFLFGLFAWETRWDGENRRGKAEGPRQAEAKKPDADGTDRSSPSPGLSAASTPSPRSLPEYSDTPFRLDKNATGEALYAQARALPHQAIPDIGTDSRYLNLLGRSAKLGYPRAFSKLGEYATRRRTWVEAYYWTWLAQRNGQPGLSSILSAIRKNWTMAGSPAETRNVHPLFPQAAGSIGRALLNLDSGRDTDAARDFLRAHHPEFLGSDKILPCVNG